LTAKDSVLTSTPQHRIEAITGAVAVHVRALRTARGWSLEELSTRSGVSKGMVVQIEAARTNPSIGTLCRIADAFGVTINRLLEEPVERVARVTDAADAPLLWQGTAGGTGRLVCGVDEPTPVELWEWHVLPGEEYASAAHQNGTREVLHILDGTLTVTVDGVDHPVRAGQTIEFQADRPHGYRNDSKRPARYVMVVAMPA
jgi:mannose-6-phosphate isomerase-like protein (cupin superfamily)/DNA-binding XRE family transcriptional regulator